MITPPLPDLRGAARPYWEAARQGELRLPRCVACGRFHFYPRHFCPHCGGGTVVWESSPGRGQVYTFTVVRSNPHPAFRDRIPYVLAMVELDEAVRIFTEIVECDPDRVRVGMRVRVAFRPVTEAITLPVFAPEVTAQ